MREGNKAFDNWCFRSWEQPAGVPTLTILLYRVCDNDAKKFNLAIDILQKAFEAGQEAGGQGNGT